jgi:glycosyltransferase involved in cell wall biosynthesis
MRVAVDARSLAAAALRGWDRYTVGLVGALTQCGIDVSLMYRRRLPIRQQHVDGLSVQLVALDDRGGLHWEQVALPRALRTFDVFHAPAEHGVPLFSPCPVVLTLHSATRQSYRDLVARGLLPGPLGRYVAADTMRTRLWDGPYFALQVKRADHVLAPSAFARDEIVRLLGVDPANVTVTPLAVSPQFVQPQDPAAAARVRAALGLRSPYLLYVGGFEAHKNVAGLLQTFAIVRAHRPDLSLVLVGTGTPPAHLLDEASALSPSEGRNVVVLHDLGPELPALYDGAELFMSLSWRESFGLPSLEAMARGIPVVISGWGAAPEVVGDAGALVDPTDPTTAAAVVLDTLRPERRQLLARRARHNAARYSWRATAERTAAVYERLTQTRRSTRTAIMGAA